MIELVKPDYAATIVWPSWKSAVRTNNLSQLDTIFKMINNPIYGLTYVSNILEFAAKLGRKNIFEDHGYVEISTSIECFIAISNLHYDLAEWFAHHHNPECATYNVKKAILENDMKSLLWLINHGYEITKDFSEKDMSTLSLEMIQYFSNDNVFKDTVTRMIFFGHWKFKEDVTLWICQNQFYFLAPETLLRNSTQNGYLDVLKYNWTKEILDRPQDIWSHSLLPIAIEQKQQHVIEWLKPKVPITEKTCKYAIRYGQDLLFKDEFKVNELIFKFSGSAIPGFYQDAWGIRNLPLMQWLYEWDQDLFDKHLFFDKTCQSIYRFHRGARSTVGFDSDEELVLLQSILLWIQSIL
jgi:hypothetical protein